MNRRKIIRYAVILITLLATVVCINTEYVYAGHPMNQMQCSKASIPGWWIVLAVLVVTVNIIRIIYRVTNGSGGRNYPRQKNRQNQMLQQQMQQQEQQRVFREQVNEHGRLFQEQQWRFQDQQIHDLNQWQNNNQF